jgi:hypothetical protein
VKDFTEEYLDIIRLASEPGHAENVRALWLKVVKMAEHNPVANRIYTLAERDGWSKDREKLALVMALAMFVNAEQTRQQLLDYVNLQPAVSFVMNGFEYARVKQLHPEEPLAQRNKAECKACFDEEGSLACVRPAHKKEKSHA